MNYKNPVLLDFAHRTRINLKALRDLKKSSPDREVYEVTQLINSMLGLLVFPIKNYKIPKTPVDELKIQGWTLPNNENSYKVKNLQEFISYLRNAIAHNQL